VTKRWLIVWVAGCGIAPVLGAPVQYTIDSDHTYPSFEAPHIQGISIWRGKLDKTRGTIVLDREAKTGHLDIVMDASSIDFGHEELNKHMKSPEFFDVAKYPTITYKASTIKFEGDTPVEVDGVLTLHGISRPVPLKINSFKCIPHPFYHREVCGADASAQLNRSDFGINSAVQMTGDWVRLAIQIEALQEQPAGT
jgi:polyisoprenoid-binding protein YceI